MACLISIFDMYEPSISLFFIDFEGAGRGAVARQDINIGDIVLEIPSSILISEDVLSESKMVNFT